jgi:tRNA dimethylallyltransferase
MLPDLLVVIGPTAVGKTDLAIRLAESVHGEIISADSRYFYEGMDIGTAKPTPEELHRVPHHLINVTTPDKPWTLAHFQLEAAKAVKDISSRGRLPILVGGTGQYIRAVTECWQVPALPPDEHLRDVLTDWGIQIGARQLHARLKILDPAAAERMDPGNLRRVVRALEVIFSTGRTFSDQRTQSDPAYRTLTIGLRRPRIDLYARIDERIDAMLANGLVDEVKSLLDKGYGPELPAMSAIGYSQVVNYLEGRLTLIEAVMLIRRSTRQFVRRQANWFKETDPTIDWFCMDPDPLDQIVVRVNSWRNR